MACAWSMADASSGGASGVLDRLVLLWNSRESGGELPDLEKNVSPANVPASVCPDSEAASLPACDSIVMLTISFIFSPPNKNAAPDSEDSETGRIFVGVFADRARPPMPCRAGWRGISPYSVRRARIFGLEMMHQMRCSRKLTSMLLIDRLMFRRPHLFRSITSRRTAQMPHAKWHLSSHWRPFRSRLNAISSMDLGAYRVRSP